MERNLLSCYCFFHSGGVICSFAKLYGYLELPKAPKMVNMSIRRVNFFPNLQPLILLKSRYGMQLIVDTSLYSTPSGR